MNVSSPSFTAREAERLHDVLESGWITQGPMTRLFEQELGTRLGVKHVIACSSGTAALHLAFEALDIWDTNVLVPDLTYIATANAVEYARGKTIFVDVDPVTWNIDLNLAAKAISDHRINPGSAGYVKAIAPVHLYGVPCDMDEMRVFAREHKLYVVEDAAEALGGSWKGDACGTMGDLGIFSFYGNKIVTMGEGGAVVTNNDKLAEKIRLLRGQGQDPNRRFWHIERGFNYRLTDMQAAIGMAQLEHFAMMVDRRNQVMNVYKRYLIDYRNPFTPRPSATIAPWLFTFLAPQGKRDHLMECLDAMNIETRPAFVPMHRQVINDRSPDEDFPVSSMIADRGISLPTHAEMEVEDAIHIAQSVLEVLR